MSSVGRYTTPTHTFEVPFDTQNVTWLELAYRQLDDVVILKHLADVKLDVKKVITTLSEAETAMLRPNVPVRIQMCVGFGKTRLNSNVIKAAVEDVLKEGMMIEV